MTPRVVEWESCGARWRGRVRFTHKANGHTFYFVTLIGCDDPAAFIPRNEERCISDENCRVVS